MTATLSNPENHKTDFYRVDNFGFTSTRVTETYPSFFYPFNPQQQDGGVFFPDFQNLEQGDFNGDGHLDIVFTWSYFPHFFARPDNIQARPLIFFNDGAGTLVSDSTRFNAAASAGGTILETAAVADFNGDGYDDVVSSAGGLNDLVNSRYIGEQIPLLLSGANGVFFNASAQIAGQQGGALPTGFTFAHDVTTGDYDRDGDIDIFTNKLLLINDGAGNFSNGSSQLPAAMRATDYFMFSSLSADFNNDGVADIAIFGGVLNQTSATSGGYVMLSSSANPIAQRSLVTLPPGLLSSSAAATRDSAAGDFDNDGDIDIVVLGSRDTPQFLYGVGLQLLANNGTGNFTDVTSGRINNAILADLTPSGGHTATTAYGGSDVSLKDWNGDGHLDLIVHSGLGSQNNTQQLLNIFQNDGTGRFDFVDIDFLPFLQPWHLDGFSGFEPFFSRPLRQTGAADLNGDRMIDFVAVVDTPITAMSDPRESTAYTMLSTAVYGTAPAGVDGAAVGAPGFNEFYYLRANPAAAAAVTQGTHATGLAHYLAVGRQEGLQSFAPGTSVYGGDGADTITLREGHERAWGGNGNDRFVSGAGNDNIDGGAGIDTAAYSGARASHTVQLTDTGLRVTGGDGTDNLTSVERLEFAGSRFAFDLAGNAGVTARLLGALLGAGAATNKEYMGLGLSLLDGGTSQSALMDLALTAVLGANPSNEAVVTLLFTNVAGAAPSAADLNLYTSLLGGELTQAQLAMAAAAHPQNDININLVGLASVGVEYL